VLRANGADAERVPRVSAQAAFRRHGGWRTAGTEASASRRVGTTERRPSDTTCGHTTAAAKASNPGFTLALVHHAIAPRLPVPARVWRAGPKPATSAAGSAPDRRTPRRTRCIAGTRPLPRGSRWTDSLCIHSATTGNQACSALRSSTASTGTTRADISRSRISWAENSTQAPDCP